MNTISPKLARGLATAICRRIHKHYPGAGIVGVYGFDGNEYSRKPALREAVLAFCETLTWEQVPQVKRRYDLI